MVRDWEVQHPCILTLNPVIRNNFNSEATRPFITAGLHIGCEECFPWTGRSGVIRTLINYY